MTRGLNEFYLCRMCDIEEKHISSNSARFKFQNPLLVVFSGKKFVFSGQKWSFWTVFGHTNLLGRRGEGTSMSLSPPLIFQPIIEFWYILSLLVFSCKNWYFRAKIGIFVQKLVFSCKNWYFRAKIGIFGQKWSFWTVFGQKSMLISGNQISNFFGAKCLSPPPPPPK